MDGDPYCLDTVEHETNSMYKRRGKEINSTTKSLNQSKSERGKHLDDTSKSLISPDTSSVENGSNGNNEKICVSKEKRTTDNHGETEKTNNSEHYPSRENTKASYKTHTEDSTYTDQTAREVNDQTLTKNCESNENGKLDFGNGTLKSKSRDENPKRYIPSPPTTPNNKILLRRPSDVGLSEEKDKRLGMTPVIFRRRSSSFTNRADSPRELLQIKARDRLERENGLQILKPKNPISCDSSSERAKIKLSRRGSTGEIQMLERLMSNKKSSAKVPGCADAPHSSPLLAENKNPPSHSSPQMAVRPGFAWKTPRRLARRSSLPLESMCTHSAAMDLNQAPVTHEHATWTSVGKITPRPGKVRACRRHSSPETTSSSPADVRSTEKRPQHIQEQLSTNYFQPRKAKLDERLRKASPKPYALPPLDTPSEIKNMEIPFADSPALRPTPERFLLPPIEGRSAPDAHPFPRRLSQPNCFPDMVKGPRKDECAEVAGSKSSPVGSPKAGKVILPPLEGRRRGSWVSPPFDLSNAQHDDSPWQTYGKCRSSSFEAKPAQRSPVRSLSPVAHYRESRCYSRHMASPPESQEFSFPTERELETSSVDGVKERRFSRQESPLATNESKERRRSRQGSKNNSPQTPPNKIFLPPIERHSSPRQSRSSSPTNVPQQARKMSPKTGQKEAFRHRQHINSPPNTEFLTKPDKFIFPIKKKQDTEDRPFSRQESPLTSSDSREKRRSRHGSKNNSPQTPPNKVILPPIEGTSSPRQSRSSSPDHEMQRNKKSSRMPLAMKEAHRAPSVSRPSSPICEVDRSRNLSSPMNGQIRPRNVSRSTSHVNEPITCRARNLSRSTSPINEPITCSAQNLSRSISRVNEPITCRARNLSRSTSPENEPITCRARNLSRSTSPENEPMTCKARNGSRSPSSENEPITCRARNLSRSTSPVNEPMRYRARNLSRSTSPENEPMTCKARNLSRSTSPENEPMTYRARNLSRSTSPENEPMTCRARNLSRSTSPENEPMTCKARNGSRSTSPVNKPITCSARKLSRPTLPVNELQRARNPSRSASPVNEGHSYRDHNTAPVNDLHRARFVQRPSSPVKESHRSRKGSRSASPVSEAQLCMGRNTAPVNDLHKARFVQRPSSPVKESHRSRKGSRSASPVSEARRACDLSRSTSPVNQPLKSRNASRSTSPVNEARARNLSRSTSPENEARARNLSRSASPVHEPRTVQKLSPIKKEHSSNLRLRSPPTPDHLLEKANFVFPIQKHQAISSVDPKDRSVRRSNSNSPQTPNKIILPPLEDPIRPRTLRPSPPPKTTEGKDGKRSPKRRKKRTFPKLKRLLLPLDTGKAMQSDLSPEPQTPGCGSRFMKFPTPPKKEYNEYNLTPENPHIIVITPPCTQKNAHFLLPDPENGNSEPGGSTTTSTVHSPLQIPSNIEGTTEPLLSRRSPTENESNHSCSSPVPQQQFFVPSPPKSPKSSRRRTSLICRGRVGSTKTDRSSPQNQGFLLPNMPTISRRNSVTLKEGVELKCDQEWSAGVTRTPRIRSPRNLRLDSRSDDEYPSNQSFTPPSPALDPLSFGFNIPSPAGSVDSEIEALLFQARRKIEKLVDNQSRSPSPNPPQNSSVDPNYLSDVFLTPSPGRSPVFELEEEDKRYSKCHFRSLSMEEDPGSDDDDDEEATKEISEVNYEGEEHLKIEVTRSKSPSLRCKERSSQQHGRENENRYLSAGSFTEVNDRLSPRSCMERRARNQQE